MWKSIVFLLKMRSNENYWFHLLVVCFRPGNRPKGPLLCYFRRWTFYSDDRVSCQLFLYWMQCKTESIELNSAKTLLRLVRMGCVLCPDALRKDFQWSIWLPSSAPVGNFGWNLAELALLLLFPTNYSEKYQNNIWWLNLLSKLVILVDLNLTSIYSSNLVMQIINWDSQWPTQPTWFPVITCCLVIMGLSSFLLKRLKNLPHLVE